MPFRKRPDQSLRRAVYLASSGGCVYCGARAASIDHVVPTRLGGVDRKHNLVSACIPCNKRKGGLSLDEFLATFPPLQQNRILDRIERAIRALHRSFYHV